MALFLSLLIALFAHDSVNNFMLPPGTVQVKENLYVDAGEISNIHYLEYLHWLKVTHGDSSVELERAAPSISLLDSLSRAMKTTSLEYLMHEEFHEFPVLGVSHRQATDFCKWRSDRVYEFRCKQNKAAQRKERTPVSNANTSVGEILKPRYDLPYQIVPKTNLYPEYRLPTPEEWDWISEQRPVQRKFHYRIIRRPYDLSEYVIQGLFGSVSEMTSVPGLSKGGSYKEGKEPNTTSWDRPYNGPSDWVGFRCVCKWKMLE